MNVKVISCFWLIFGFVKIYLGISYYFQYSQDGVMWFIYVPVEDAVENIIYGMLSVFLGIKLLKKCWSKLILTIPFSAIALSIIITIKDYLLYDFLNLINLININYMFIVFSIVSIKILQEESVISKFSFLRIFKKDFIFIIIGTVIINALVFILARFLPYEVFSH